MRDVEEVTALKDIIATQMHSFSSERLLNKTLLTIQCAKETLLKMGDEIQTHSLPLPTLQLIQHDEACVEGPSLLTVRRTKCDAVFR